MTDNAGTVRDIVDAAGNLVDHIDYDSFGRILAETNTTFGDRYKFTGREYNEVSGLYYYRARWYDPQLGRFLSVDPLGIFAGDANFYRYVGNSPLTYIDPTGMAGDLLFYPAAIQYDLAVAGAVNGFTFGYTCGYLDAFYSGSPNPTIEALAMAAEGAAIGAAIKYSPQEVGLFASVVLAVQGVESIAEAANAGNVPVLAVRTVCFTASIGYTLRQGLKQAPRRNVPRNATEQQAPRRMTPNQQALNELANEAKLRGRTKPISKDDAATLRQWADEYGVSSRGPEVHPNRPIGKNPHIHIGNVDHIHVKL